MVSSVAKPRLFWLLFFFSSRRRHTRFDCDWSSDVCSSDLEAPARVPRIGFLGASEPTAEFREGLREFGYLEGQNLSIEYRNTGQAVDSVPELRSEERRVGKECRSRWSPYH